MKETAKVTDISRNNTRNEYYGNIYPLPGCYSLVSVESLRMAYLPLIENIENKSDWKTTSRGVYYYEFDKGKYFIKYAHPEARVSDNLLYYGLIDAIKELKNNR